MVFMIDLVRSWTYFPQNTCSCTRTEYKNQGHSTALCKFGMHQL